MESDGVQIRTEPAGSADPTVPVRPWSGTEDDTSGPPQLGHTWGRYLIQRELGRGGQADVFLALDRQGGAGQVALKVSRYPLTGDRLAEWTRREADPLSRLAHPNIVRIHDAGANADYPYVATASVNALPLDRHVAASPPDLRTIYRWMMALADALDAAHRQGVIHNDLNPANVLIAAGQGPVVIDFGIASMAVPYGEGEPSPSGGTPQFIAPERARGTGAGDQRTDIFGLGALLKFLLDGRGPYDPDPDGLACARAGRVESVDEGAGPALRRALARIANRALAVRPELRHPTARALFLELQQIHRARNLTAAVVVGLLAAAAVWAVVAGAR